MDPPYYPNIVINFVHKLKLIWPRLSRYFLESSLILFGLNADARRENVIDSPRIVPTMISTRLWLSSNISHVGRASQSTINILNPMKTKTSANPYFR